jgi:hypothetical protein
MFNVPHILVEPHKGCLENILSCHPVAGHPECIVEEFLLISVVVKREIENIVHKKIYFLNIKDVQKKEQLVVKCKIFFKTNKAVSIETASFLISVNEWISVNT